MGWRMQLDPLSDIFEAFRCITNDRGLQLGGVSRSAHYRRVEFHNCRVTSPWYVLGCEQAVESEDI